MRKSRLYERRTKIVCTIGPSVSSEKMLPKLIRAGMDVARLNLSYGKLSEHALHIALIRKLSHKLGIDVAILMDLPGPKYRIGKLGNGQVTLKKGNEVTLTSKQVDGNDLLLPITLPNLSKGLKVGQIILLDDGGLQLKVREIKNDEVKCRVTVGGLLRQGRGLVVPGMPILNPFITDTLRELILFAVKQKPDYLALSFVTSAKDITDVRTILRENGADIPIIAKIERQEAVRLFDSILKESDAIMVARGDLGVEIPLERVPMVQKDIIQKCNRSGKPVITATEMLESMIESPRPTRAEVSDVANAIFDGTDAIMLSAETSIGKYPVEAVTIMGRISCEAERKLPYELMLTERRDWFEKSTEELISYNACLTAERLGARAIVAFTRTGSTAGRVSKYRPQMVILAITPSDIRGQLSLHWGVHPFRVDVPTSLSELINIGASLSKNLGLAKAGDLIVITGGIPVGEPGSTNLLKVEKIS